MKTTNERNIYDEPTALAELLRAINRAVAELNDLYESGNCDAADKMRITITVGNEPPVQLLLGGPQVAGLDALVEHIASENYYNVDFANCTVTE